MKKVLILGATGMLGSACFDVLKEKYDLTLTVRSADKVPLLDAYGGTEGRRVLEFDARGDAAYLKNFFASVTDADYVVNAIGVTAPFAEKDPEQTMFVNGKFPHILADAFGSRLIHIATDGVYDGKSGPYDEKAAKSPVGLYALSKSEGEPTNCLTLRTSIIGREREGFTGLVEWFLQQRGKTIKGFAEQYWNGITASEFGIICDKIMSEPEKYPGKGIYHIFSNTVSKYDMLCAFKEKWEVDCEIVAEREHAANRTLATIHDLNAKLAIPSFAEMLATLP